MCVCVSYTLRGLASLTVLGSLFLFSLSVTTVLFPFPPAAAHGRYMGAWAANTAAAPLRERESYETCRTSFSLLFLTGHSSHVTFFGVGRNTKTMSDSSFISYSFLPLLKTCLIFPSSNRIKTNGSLPRERRLQSPQPANGSSTPSRHLLNSSEDELSGIFTFDSSSSHLHHNQQQQQPAPVSPGVAMESVLLSTTSSVSAAVNSKSPYENVAAAMHQQPPVSPVAPGSPRTRIRTTLQTPAVNFKETNGTTSSTSSSASSSSSSYPTYQLITSGVAAEVLDNSIIKMNRLTN